MDNETFVIANHALSIAALDIGKKEDEVYHDGARSKLANRPPDIDRWLDKLTQDTLIAMEATGGYGLMLAERATRRGFTVYVLSPRQVRHYRRSLGRRAKNDRADARLIWEHVRANHQLLRPFVLWDEPWKSLRNLVRERASLIDHMASMRQSLRARGRSDKQVEAVLESTRRYTQDLHRRIHELVKQTPGGRELLAVSGIGPITAGGSLAALGQIPFAHKDAFVAWIGNDLIVDESSTRKSVRKITSWGDRSLRCAFFNAARSASRTDTWRPYYQAQLDKGLCPTAALCALARKMQRKVFGVYRSTVIPAHSRLDMQP